MIGFRVIVCLGMCLTAFGILTSVCFSADETNVDLVQLVVDLLGDSDKDMRALGFEQVRSEISGQAATIQFANQLAKISPEAQVGLLSALATRGDTAARPAVVKTLISTKNEKVKIASIEALGFLGSPEDCARLIQSLSTGNKAEQGAARGSLVRLLGDSVPKSIAEQMMRAKTPQRVALIEILVARRALETIPSIIDSTLDKDPVVRRAAMSAMGEIGSSDHIPDMVKGVLIAEGAERAAAEKAIMFVCSRIKDERQRADPLLVAMNKLNSKDRNAMLSTLGRVGGPKALKTVETAVASRNADIHREGLKALCNWPNASVAPQLIKLVKTDKHGSHPLTALRALIRVAPLPDGRTDKQKLDLLKQCMTMATRDTERLLILKRAQAIRIPETLRFVLSYLDNPKFTEQVCRSVVELAHHRELRDNNKAEFHKALDLVIATSKDETAIDRARRYKKGQTWVRPK